MKTSQRSIDHMPNRYNNFPQTRFQGSKARLLDWFHKHLSKLNYETVLDAFSGSCVVSYYFKTQNKSVTSNDILKSSYITAKAFIENSVKKVGNDVLNSVMDIPEYEDHQHLIEENYQEFYFTDSENIWLDGIISNIQRIEDEYKQSILYWALFQSCVIKRPYNLFHRKNLYMRTDEVERSFGNKTTWDRSFPTYIKKFVEEANTAVFDNKLHNRAINQDIGQIENTDYDLIYIDPPYMKQNTNMSGNDYQDYYHFLEGILDYENWENKINRDLKHNPYHQEKSKWIDPDQIIAEFEQLFDKFQDSKIVISYNTEGYPSPDRLEELLYSYKTSVKIQYKDIKYALKKKDKINTEVLIIS